jgi:hypothetical protein
LFVILGLEFLRDWHYDPVLLAIAMCAAAASLSWLVVSVVHVGRNLRAAEPTSSQGVALPPASAAAG